MIFENIAEVNRNADGNREAPRISFDTKAKMKIGGFSRNEKSRLPEPAADHDMNPENILLPLGILEKRIVDRDEKVKKGLLCKGVGSFFEIERG